MTFTAYIQRQKSLIRSRNGIQAMPKAYREQITPEYSTEELFGHLSSIKGLNTAERQRYSKIFSNV